MALNKIASAHEELLSRLERQELGWLSWGRVDGSLSEAEVTEAAQTVLRHDAQELSGQSLVDDLLDHHLLIDLGDEPPRYRTRFAESVRLLARVRQLTPGRDFREAAQLVNDYRVVARPRTFPRREITPEAAIAELTEDSTASVVELAALEAMIRPQGGELFLSRFQLDAIRRIRREVAAARTSATIVCAGTGSGKTKAFYIPALAAVATGSGADSWVRILALYPRNELLKDQLAEALSQIEFIAAAGGPILSLGALFGPTQWTAEQVKKDAQGDSHGWTRAEHGYACRYVRCPQGCLEDLVWLETDLHAGLEVLQCPRCSWRSREGQLALTRGGIKAQPPDVLFTTTEMLNRGLADVEFRSTFVGAAGRRPHLLLLDEVHTYGGTHGAQVALLLRRWRNALGRGSPLHVVGLSATLENPAEFMTKITGLTEVQEIGPNDEDLEWRGAEYALVLRGNPVSGTALLSTTIQTTFLLARLLEARSLRDQSGSSGSKVFAFTDDLDVTNRLYWNIRSAEGIYGNRQVAPLAALRRRSGVTNPGAMEADGQIWDLCQQLGHALGPTNRLGIARTSSQDAGVDPHADVIVATSSLEVGFDDPEVGAVVQHKAPRDDAAFIQRKGRAGRRQAIRPWTVVVLSDYGRDRARYQGYETLFAPVLAGRSLPVDNLHLLKMQSAYALLDWLSLQVPGLRARADLSEPVTGQKPWDRQRLERQRKTATLLHLVLSDPRRERDLSRHLRQALELDEERLTAVLWEAPRALMTSTVPMLLRRLEANWTTAVGGADRPVRDVPLPEHAPQALFSDLNLPEVRVGVPGRRPSDSRREFAMPIVQALSEFPPGRASRRFAVESSAAWHWVPVPDPDPDGRFVADIEEFIPLSETVGTIQVDGEAEARPLLRPWRLELSLADRQAQQGNARPLWQTQITATSSSWGFELPAKAPGSRLVDGLHFHTAALGNEVEVARGVTGAVATNRDAETELVLARVVADSTELVALGFSAPVDVVRISLGKNAVPKFASLPPEAQRAALTAWFEEQVVSDGDLRRQASHFSLGWLAMLYLAAVAGVSVAHGEKPLSLRDAVDAMERAGVAKSLERALEAVFVADEVDPESDDTRGVARLRALIHDHDVVERMTDLGHRLATTGSSELDRWIPRLVASTAGVAFRESFQRLCPDIDAEGLIVDLDPAVEPAATPDAIDVWLCEPDVGSGGTIEEIRRQASADPGRLARLLAAALAPTDYEVVDWSVRRALLTAREVESVATAFARVRAARTGEDTMKALREMRSALRASGVATDHAVISTLNLRVLRPGSSEATDAAVIDALALWETAEESLGIELDARSIAYAMSRRSEVDLSLEQVYSLLWPRGRAARGSGRSAYSRFGELPLTDPLLLRGVLGDNTPELDLESASADDARETLARTGSIRITTAGSTNALQARVIDLIGEPVEVGSVMAYPRTTGVGRSSKGAWATFELAEALS